MTTPTAKKVKHKFRLDYSRDFDQVETLETRILAIPVSNAFLERIFSLCGAQWTNERNRLDVSTVKALLQVQANVDYKCGDMFKLLMKDDELRRKIAGVEKY